MNEITNKSPFKRNGKTVRASKKSAVYYTTDCGGDDQSEKSNSKLQHRSASLTALHVNSGLPQQLLEPRMDQLETLEAKMASIEVSLSALSRRKKGSNISSGMTSPANHRSRDHYKELDALKVALRDKENIIQTLKGQLCNTLSNRLVLRNGAPPLTEADRKATEERLQRLRKDADKRKLAIKNLKLALERLDITDNIDIRIQQAELEYRLGREELELLTIKEESRTLQTALELAETHEKQKNDTIYSCLAGNHHITIHAIEVSADPKSPRFGAGPRDDAAGLYVDWAVEDSGLCKGDRILEVNGKCVVGAGRSDLARLLAVAPDAAQIVVLRKGESLSAIRNLRSDNLRLTHRISYLEEQVRDLLNPRNEVDERNTPPPRKDNHIQVFQKGPQVTAVISGYPGMGNLTGSPDTRQSLPNVKAMRQSDFHPMEQQHHNLDNGLPSVSKHRSPRTKHHRSSVYNGALQVAKSTASLEMTSSVSAANKEAISNGQQMNSVTATSAPRRRPPRVDAAYNEHMHFKSRKHQQLQSLEFDSEPTYYRLQDNQSRVSEHSEASCATGTYQENGKCRPAPPKKPLRLSLHRATSLQSVESAPPGTTITSSQQESLYNGKKPMKRNHRGDPPNHTDKSLESISSAQEPPQNTPSRTPSRAESCQSALKWPSPKPRPHLPHISLEKWC